MEIFPYLPELAYLRIELFREYPNLYDGDAEYEKEYLRTYVNCSESILVLAFDGTEVVGASTAIPLGFATLHAQKPFLERQMPVQDFFYLGDSVLLPAYRGKGIYRRFFEEREAAARLFRAKFVAFCAVERRADDPRRPKNYQPLDKVWNHFGYVKHPELCSYFSWKEIGAKEESVKPMIYWIKVL